MRVVKNTLARKAVAGTAFENIGPILKGPLVLAFSKDDPGAAARVLKAFAKDHDKLIATAVSLGGQLLPGKDLDKVAALPTRDQALAQLMGVMRAPIQKLVGTLAATPSKLVRTLDAVRVQKQAASA
jgi:large subunit ribosomal protein L10